MSTKVWQEDYERDWMRAFPLGNGRVGAMLYGDPYCETIEINEESLWSGRQIEEKFNSSPEALEKVRALLLDECYEEAAALCEKNFMSDPPKVRFFESMGEVKIEFPDNRRYENYCKELELSEAIGRVSYKKGKTEYKSETFVSEKYDGLVYKVSATSEFDCYVTMERGQDAYTSALHKDLLFLNGCVTYYDEDEYGECGEGMSFGANIFVRTDGTISNEKKRILVENATWVIVYGVFETNYSIETYDIDESVDYRAVLRAKLEAMKAVDYETIKAEHIADHKAVFDTVSLHLDSEDRYENVSLATVPTEWRLYYLQMQRTEDIDFFELYYNFGRYLLIESGAKNARLPSNIQGIWSNGFRPEWGSDYHFNINTEMNYWPAGPANIPSAMPPLVYMVKMLSKFGVRTARELLGCKGWIVNTTTDVFGRTGPHDLVHCFFPLAGAWLCLNIWEHYEFTDDAEYLKEIYPILKGSAEFILDFLIEDGNGHLTTAPSNSPENWYYYTDKNGERKMTGFTHGATIDFEMIYMLFTRLIHACELLGVDADFVTQLEATLRRLPPFRLSERYNGTLCEWIEDYEETQPNHRHISHLFGLHPGDQINETIPEIYEAARKSLERRLAYGGAQTGWSRAWVINFFARLKDGEKAWENLQQLIVKSTANNLFDIHPPFQIDGNFGGVAGMTEMLLQSHLGKPGARVIDVLPALPNAWKGGSVRGLKARGNFTVDIEWSDCKVTKLVITAGNDSVMRLKVGEKLSALAAQMPAENGIFTKAMAADETLTLA